MEILYQDKLDRLVDYIEKHGDNKGVRRIDVEAWFNPDNSSLVRASLATHLRGAHVLRLMKKTSSENIITFWPIKSRTYSDRRVKPEYLWDFRLSAFEL